jgi:peptidoglycan/xylan/chitin deacetylase (PgdA/CDA1 family)
MDFGPVPKVEDSIYLTFDDGPDPEWTPRVLEALDHAKMQATFFVIGEHARRLPELTRRVAAAGHAVGNHTYSHRHPWFMSSERARAQVRDGAQVLSDVLGAEPYLYRPPHGRTRRCMIEEAEQRGERVVLWDVSAVDWGPMGNATSIMQRLTSVRPNDIVLMHDGPNRRNRPEELLKVLPVFLEYLGRRGMRGSRLPEAEE